LKIASCAGVLVRWCAGAFLQNGHQTMGKTMINSGISVSPLISWPFLDVNHQHLGVPNPSTTGSLVVSDLVISIHGLFRGMIIH